MIGPGLDLQECCACGYPIRSGAEQPTGLSDHETCDCCCKPVHDWAAQRARDGQVYCTTCDVVARALLVRSGGDR
jgi:hypothetical protein